MSGPRASAPPAPTAAQNTAGRARIRPAGNPVGAHPWKTARLAVAALFLMNGVLFSNWVSRIPAVQAERGLSHGALGLALLALGLGALIAMPMAGWASARFGSDRVCRWTTLGYCAALPCLALAPGTAAFVAALFFFGAVHGALDVAMNLQAVDLSRGYPRPIMSSFHAMFSIGGLAGSLIGGAAAAAGINPRAHFLAVSGLLVTSVAFFVLPHLYRGREEAAPTVLGEAARETTSLRPSGTLVILGIIAFCVMMGEGAMADWSALFLRRVAGAGEGIAAAGYAAFSVAMAIGRLSGDRLSLRFGPVVLVRASGLLAASGLLLALFAGHPLVSLAGFAIVGTGFATVVPQVFSAAGHSIAAVTTIGYLGFLIGPPLIGFAAELLGLRDALVIIIGTSLLMAALAGWVGTSRRRNSERRPSAESFQPLQELT